jgi:hypothetical protein
MNQVNFLLILGLFGSFANSTTKTTSKHEQATTSSDTAAGASAL